MKNTDTMRKHGVSLSSQYGTKNVTRFGLPTLQSLGRAQLGHEHRHVFHEFPFRHALVPNVHLSRSFLAQGGSPRHQTRLRNGSHGFTVGVLIMPLWCVGVTSGRSRDWNETCWGTVGTEAFSWTF